MSDEQIFGDDSKLSLKFNHISQERDLAVQDLLKAIKGIIVTHPHLNEKDPSVLIWKRAFDQVNNKIM